MKNMRTAFAAIAFLAVGLVARADDAAVKKELQAQYDAFGKAFLKKDLAAIKKMGAPGFTTKAMDGQERNAKESLKMMKEEFARIPPGGTLKTRVTKVTVKGNKAVSDAAMEWKNDVQGQDGKKHKMVVSGTSHDTWIKIGGKWKVLRTEDTSQNITMDGQKFDPSMVGGGGGR